MTFAEVTGDYGCVISRLNQYFNTDFRVFEPTEDSLRGRLALVVEMGRRDKQVGGCECRDGRAPDW